MIKILNQRDIKEALNSGHRMVYKTLEGKVLMVTNEYEVLGAVRFDTYLKLCKELKLIKANNSLFWQSDDYIIEKE